MAPLSVDLRNQLARTIQAARRDAESGARKAIESLAVHLAKAHDSMDADADARKLRGRLRAHGKQLGDERHPVKDTQNVDHLKHEVAYEHWHRMLFARFLAENHLLIEPTSGVAISIGDCEELAREQGADQWALAASFAQRMLPRIFRTDDPSLEVQLPPEARLALERHLESLPVEVFTADDALGWTYQFWQTEKKEEINRAGAEIGADELPAVTQLFTDHYMVLFLFHNTIGAWRAGRILIGSPELAENAHDEDELRRAVRVASHGGYDFTYLRFVRERREGDAEGAPSGRWRPAAGTFDGWPKRVAALRVLDPCCGSGHFLVEGFDLLVRLRMEEEGVSFDRAVAAVITDNLFGLEIDARCTQIAAFNLALAAWKLLGKPVELPPFNIGCSGTAVSSTRDEWMGILAERGDPQLRFFFGELHNLFAKAPTLGSLINPRALAEGWLGAKGLEGLLGALSDAVSSDAPERHELGVAALGLARATELLAGRYTLVITNVPYLGRGNQGETLKDHLEAQYSSGKGDLATAFVLRCLEFCGEGGATALVTPQNWLFLTTYKTLREKLLRTRRWHLVARLGPGAFETISGEVVSVALLILAANIPDRDSEMAGVDASAPRGGTPVRAAEKAKILRGQQTAPLVVIRQLEQAANADARIVLDTPKRGTMLGDFAGSFWGQGTGDYPRFVRCFWECRLGRTWARLQGSVRTFTPFGGRERIVLWESSGPSLLRIAGELREVEGHSGIRPTRGDEAWGRNGVCVRLMSTLVCTRYEGEIFDSNCAAVVPNAQEDLPAIWEFCSSDDFRTAVGKIDQKVNVVNQTLLKVPFDREHWTGIATERNPDGLPEPESDDPTQWLFHGRPDHSADPLQVAVARLLGYRWPSELDETIRLSARARDLVRRCDDLLCFTAESGIVCIPSLRGEKPGADRLLPLLSACGLKPERDLDEWLRNEFFEEHCKLFHHRPFIWHIWDGRPDGFHALVNYHCLAGPNGEGRRLLEALTYSYLGDWIERQKADQRDGKDGADARLAAAQDLQAQLERILAGEPPCDIFVRWKPLHQQPVGWEPDINDGVGLNIRPFLSVALRKGGRAGAGVLRWKPNINWKKDRGTEPQGIRPPEEFPWFWGCSGEGSLEERTDFPGSADYDGSRWNDLHYTNAVKQAARVRAAVGRQ